MQSPLLDHSRLGQAEEAKIESRASILGDDVHDFSTGR